MDPNISSVSVILSQVKKNGDCQLFLFHLFFMFRSLYVMHEADKCLIFVLVARSALFISLQYLETFEI